MTSIPMTPNSGPEAPKPPEAPGPAETASVVGGPSTTSAGRKTRDPRDTPAMRQYARFKAQHPDCVLFFRMGDFYEMFDDDAILAHKALGITLTQRSAGIPMAGVPHHAMETYLRRMIEQGYRVAICDQVQDAAEAIGVVDRAVTRVLTPGTLTDEALLDESRANHIAAIQFLEAGDHAAAVAAVIELSTGSFTLHDLPADRAIDELLRIAPSELLYVETADGTVPPRVQSVTVDSACALTARPAWTYRLSDAADCVRRHFGVRALKGFGLAEDDPALGPAGALLRYLQETQTPDALGETPQSPQLTHIRPPKRLSPDGFLILDSASFRNLEIDRTMRTGQTEGSVLSVLQRCRTAMGKRLLRHWLCFPLRDITAIDRRQQAVAGLLEDERLARALTDAIGSVQDVARIVGRVAVRRATPRDVVALGRSVGPIRRIVELLEPCPTLVDHVQRLSSVAECLTPIADTITARCVDAPPAHLRDGGLFRDDVDARLDEARGLQRDANTWLAAYQKQLCEQTGIPSLKVGFNRVFGYYIEITNVHRDKAPEHFTRKQTLKNAERYITPELKEFEEKVTTARSRALDRERELFERLCSEVSSAAAALTEYAETIAELDVLLCFSVVAREHDYVRPTIVPEATLHIVQGRHVVLDKTLGDGFVPNDCELGRHEMESERAGPSPARPTSDSENATLALITGPNMAGKSTYIRQVALIVLLAHTGCYVPAESATIGLTDRIFTRIGASDELHAGQSTFMVEMTEAAHILHHATDRSLVILDEIGRGTSTLDGLALAWAIAEALARRECRTLFATHYHELTALAEQIANVRNLHVAVREWGDDIIFVYRILPGRTDRSYGIHVARIAGLPPETIQRADELLRSLEVQTESSTGKNTETNRSAPEPDGQLGLFTEYLDHPAVQKLREIDLTTMTPMQAFDALRQLIESANSHSDQEEKP